MSDLSRWSRIQVLMSMSRYDEALQVLTEELAEDPNDSSTKAHMAHCLILLDRHAEAKKMAEQAIVDDPENEFAYWVAAQIYTITGKQKKALQAINTAIEFDNEDVNNWHLKAQITANQKDWKSSAEAARQGLRLDPDHTDCRRLLARAMSALGEHEHADRVLTGVLGDDPNDPWVFIDRARVQIDQKQYKEAEASLREALRIDPENESARDFLMFLAQRRSPLLRILFQIQWWLAHKPATQQWGFFGVFFAIYIVTHQFRSHPTLGIPAFVLCLLMLTACVLLFLARHLIHLTMFAYSSTRLILNSDEKRTALLALTSIVAWLVIQFSVVHKGFIDDIFLTVGVVWMVAWLNLLLDEIVNRPRFIIGTYLATTGIYTLNLMLFFHYEPLIQLLHANLIFFLLVFVCEPLAREFEWIE